MNETIALPHLAEQLAAMANIDIPSAEKFIRVFFAQVENALTISDSVTINGIGKFYLSGNHDEPIGFTPDSRLAAALNEPFEMFSPEEIEDEFVEEIDDCINIAPREDEPQKQALPEEQTETQDNRDVIVKQSTEEIEEIIVEDNITEQEPEDIAADTVTTPEPEEDVNQAEKSAASEEINLIDEADEPLPDSFNYDQNDRKPVHYNIMLILMLLTGIIIGFFAGYFGHNRIAVLYGNTDENQQNINLTDSIAVPIEEALEINDTIPIDTAVIAEEIIEEPEPVYDIITPERFLTTMARKYYGQMEYWVFIYEANAEVLGNPNRIKPGTKVLIPDKETFSEGETEQQTLARAKRMGTEIYDRFK